MNTHDDQVICAVESLVDAVYVLQVDPVPRLEYVSESVRALTGYSAADLLSDASLGRSLVDREALAAIDSLAGAEVGHGVGLVTRMVRRDGAEVWVEHRCVKLGRGDGSTVIVGAARDQTVEHDAWAGLRRSEDLVEQMLAEITDAVLVFDAEGALRYASPSTSRLFGWDTDDLIGTPLLRDLLGHGYPSVGEAAAARATGDDAAGSRFEVVTAEGTTRWVERVDRVLRRADGAVDGIILVARDVTDQVIAERQADEARVQFRLLAENAADIVTWGDATGRLEWVSPSVREFLGYAPEELIGRRAAALVHPDDLPDARLAEGDVLAGVPGRVEVRVRRADGTYRWFSVLGRSIRVDGRVVGRVAGWRDTDADHALAARLTQTCQRLTLVTQNMADVVLLSGPGATIRWVSSSAGDVLGWGEGELVGRRVVDLIHPDDRADAVGLRQDIMTGVADTRSGEFRFATGDGAWRWMSVSGRVVRDDDGTPCGGVDVLRDVQAERDARAALRVENDWLTAAVSAVSDRVLRLLPVRDEAGSVVDFRCVAATAGAGRGPDADAGLVGRTLRAGLPGLSAASVLADLRTALTAGQPGRILSPAASDAVGRAGAPVEVKVVPHGDGVCLVWPVGST